MESVRGEGRNLTVAATSPGVSTGTAVDAVRRMAKSRKRQDGAAAPADSPETASAPETASFAETASESTAVGTSGRDAADNRNYADRVAMRAYELYLARGAADGRDFDDWLAAERELAGPRDDDRGE